MKPNIFDIKVPVKHFSLAPRPDAVALEEIADGVLKTENEVVIYAKLTDPTFLDSLKREDQEQFSYSVNTTNSNGELRVVQRVRKTTVDGSVQYTRTTKVFSDPQAENQISEELTLETNEAEFELFKKLAPNGMIKSRFFLPVSGIENADSLQFEIDAYPKEGGGFEEWVKIDLEVPVEQADAAKWEDLLPDVFTDKIRKSQSNTDEEKTKITELYENYFLTKV